jgi:hypothetical protein
MKRHGQLRQPLKEDYPEFLRLSFVRFGQELAADRAPLPASSICRAAVPIVPGIERRSSDVLAAVAILAPSWAARSAMARPIPREPPLIKMVLPASVLFTAIPYGDKK